LYTTSFFILLLLNINTDYNLIKFIKLCQMFIFLVLLLYFPIYIFVMIQNKIILQKNFQYIHIYYYNKKKKN
jgi:hypothetical protein